MIENIEESKFVELRKEFYKETRTFAMTNKKGYTKWLEAKLVKKLTVPDVMVTSCCKGTGFIDLPNGEDVYCCCKKGKEQRLQQY